jgi:hypothetical protein
MAAKPTTLPRWGETVGGVVGPTEAEPASGKKDIGWADAELPPAGYFNWWKRLVYKWIAYVDGLCCTALTYVGNPGNVASTAYYAWAATTTTAGSPPTNGSTPATGWQTGQTTHMVGLAGVVQQLAIRTGVLTVGGAVTVTLMKNGIAVPGFSQVIPAGTAQGTIYTVAPGPQAVAVGDLLEVQIANGVGVTQSIGVSPITVVLAQA